MGDCNGSVKGECSGNRMGDCSGSVMGDCSGNRMGDCSVSVMGDCSGNRMGDSGGNRISVVHLTLDGVNGKWCWRRNLCQIDGESSKLRRQSSEFSDGNAVIYDSYLRCLFWMTPYVHSSDTHKLMPAPSNTFYIHMHTHKLMHTHQCCAPDAWRHQW